LVEPIVANLTVPSGRHEIEFCDTALPGFRLRVTQAGRKIWTVWQGTNGPRHRITFQPAYPELGAAAARARAETLLAVPRAPVASAPPPRMLPPRGRDGRFLPNPSQPNGVESSGSPSAANESTVVTALDAAVARFEAPGDRLTELQRSLNRIEVIIGDMRLSQYREIMAGLRRLESLLATQGELSVDRRHRRAACGCTEQIGRGATTDPRAPRVGFAHANRNPARAGANQPAPARAPDAQAPARSRLMPRQDPLAFAPQPARKGRDYWATPSCLTAALVRHVLPEFPPGRSGNARPGPVSWCGPCAPPDTRLSAPIFSSSGTTGLGAATSCTIRSRRRAQAVAVTNPPWSHWNKFVVRGLSLLDSGRIAGLVLLLRLDHLQSDQRVACFNRVNFEVRCNWRPLWVPGTTRKGRWSAHWLAWWNGPRHPPLYLRESDIAQAQLPLFGSASVIAQQLRRPKAGTADASLGAVP
jgi:hypothetical protein